MNQALKYFLLLTVFALVFSSCEEDEYGDWKTLNDQWLATHQNDEGFTRTESGLCYKIIHQGYLRYPNSSSIIDVTFEGKMIDGTVFDSGRYYNYLSSTIKGWQEGLKLMRGGARFIFYVPSELGYGEEGVSDIPPHTTLIFDVTLNSSEQ